MDQNEFSHAEVAESGPNLVFIADSSGRFKYVNSEWDSYTGADLATLTEHAGRALLGIVHPDDVALTLERWKQSLETGEQFEIQYRLRSAKDGSYRWFLTRARAIREDGKIVRWAGVATDIDKQVRASEGSWFLSEAANVLSSSLESDKILSAFCRMAVTRFCDSCAIIFSDGDTYSLGGFAHRDPSIKPRVSLGDGIPRADMGELDFVVKSKEPLLKAGSDEEVLAVPMIVVDRVIGLITFVSADEARRYGSSDMEIATAAARQVAVALENIRSFERFRLLGRATDQLFARGETSAKLRALLTVIVQDVADWAALYVFGPNATIRLQEVVHRDPLKSALLSEARGQRVFNVPSEQQFYQKLTGHRSLLRQKSDVERLRETLKPYLVPVFAQATPQSMLTVPLYTNDEVYGALTIYSERRSFGGVELELMQEVARRVALAFEHNESIDRERRLTQTLQEVTLPAQLPTIPAALTSTVYMPATTSDAQLGGDWYDVFELSGGRFLLSIGDVTGRGLQASAIMGKLRHSINVVAMYEPNPARILDAAERVMQQRYRDAVATAFIAIYDPREASLVYANAGHPYPMLRMHDGSVEPLIAEGLPIGLRMMDRAAEPRSRRINDVRLLAMYTDGVVEATHEPEAGEKRLQAVFRSDALPFVRNPATLIAAACLPLQALDDAAILVVSFPDPTTWMFQADHAKAASDARWAFVNQLRREGVDQEQVDVAEIIFGELVANVVRHAPGAIDIALEWSKRQAVLHVIDRGPGFTRRTSGGNNPLKESGRGLWLVEQFGGTIDVERIEGFGTHVRAALPAGMPAAAVAHN